MYIKLNPCLNLCNIYCFSLKTWHILFLRLKIKSIIFKMYKKFYMINVCLLGINQKKS